MGKGVGNSRLQKRSINILSNNVSIAVHFILIIRSRTSDSMKTENKNTKDKCNKSSFFRVSEVFRKNKKGGCYHPR
jgi:hypothetical protein